MGYLKIASIAKLYDAAAITKCVGGREDSIGWLLTDYLPTISERIEYADKITIRMLVQHRMGNIYSKRY
jgi:D-alanyl-D-alanine carboxypeptidase